MLTIGNQPIIIHSHFSEQVFMLILKSVNPVNAYPQVMTLKS